MSQLLVRDLDPELVKQLKLQAKSHGRSAEAEHRAILQAALLTPHVPSFKQMLAAMPDAGCDEDFCRPRQRTRKVVL